MSTRLPPLERLRVFEAAARHLSFKEAAGELHITPSAVSHQIKALEGHLGFSLFRRLNRGLALTESGAAYLAVVSAGLTALGRGHAHVMQQHGRPALRIHTVAFLAELLIPRLDSFRRAHPDIQLRIETSLETVDLEREDVDLGLRIGEGKWPGLHCEKLIPLSLAPVCAPGFAKQAGLRQPHDICTQTLIDFISYPEAWRLWLRHKKVEYPADGRKLLLDGYTAMLLAAEQGLGVAIGMFPLVNPWLRRKRLVASFRERVAGNWSVYLACRPGDEQRPEIRAFRRWLGAWARELSDE